MKAFEFQAQIENGQTLPVPPEIAHQLPQKSPLRVIVLVGEEDDEEEERAWIRFGNEQFLKGYAESDAIYDDLQ
jgi:hypothetical protein